MPIHLETDFKINTLMVAENHWKFCWM